MKTVQNIVLTSIRKDIFDIEYSQEVGVQNETEFHIDLIQHMTHKELLKTMRRIIQTRFTQLDQEQLIAYQEIIQNLEREIK